MAISQSIIADKSSDIVQKTKFIGYAYSACSLGYVIGPLFGGSVAGVQGIARVFYCVQIGQEIVMLHSFIKKTQETPKKELEIAKKRLREIKNG